MLKDSLLRDSSPRDAPPSEPGSVAPDFPFRKFLRRKTDGPAVLWKETVFLGLLGFGVTLMLVLAVLALRKVEWRAWTGRQEPVLVQAPEPEPPRPEEADTALDVSVLSPRALTGKVAFRRALVLEPPFEPVAAQVFKSEALTVVLGGIEGPVATTVCEDEAKSLWACGLQARLALYNLIRVGPVICEPFSVLDEIAAARSGNAGASRCIARGLNVAAELVRAGYARPTGLPVRAMVDAEAEARLAGRGLWRGGWRIIR